jgi:hypothetical protein
MKIIIFLIVFIFIYSGFKSQIIVKDTITKKVIFGLHSVGAGYNFKDTLTGDKFFYRDIYIEPYIGYFFNRNFGIGTIGGYESISSNIDTIASKKYFEIGGFTRIYYPFRFNSKKLKGVNSILFLTELSYKFTTYQKINSTQYESTNKLQYTLLTIIPFGLQFKLWKGLYFEISPEYWFFSNNYSEFRYRIGIEYHINKNNGRK